MESKVFTVTGMTCGNCEQHVREEVETISGITSIEVSRETGILRVTSEAPIDDAAVIAAVDEAGYSAVAA